MIAVIEWSGPQFWNPS